MNYTFFLGNGFDKQCDLKTSYIEVMNAYEKELPYKSSGILIKHFKNPSEEWFDFEEAIYKYSNNFSSISELKLCVSDFKKFLKKYLQIEEKIFVETYFKNQGPFVNEMKRSIKELDKGLLPNERDALNNDKINTVSFISLNYTLVIDLLIEKTQEMITQSDHNRRLFISNMLKGDLVHAHGTNELGIVLGADNVQQFIDHNTKLSFQDERALVKQTFIDNFNRQNDTKALDILSNTDVLCIFGASLGDSDDRWRKRITQWFLGASNRRIIKYYRQDDTPEQDDEPMWMDNEDRLKEEFAKKLNIPLEKNNLDRIFIPFGKEIFKFKPIIETINKNNKNNI